MSEIASRPAPTRGRSSARGGRGGSRGGRSGGYRQTNGDHKDAQEIDTSAEEGELGELKQKYFSQVVILKELFPAWADADLVLALHETDGNLDNTIERITEGNVSQFSDVKKKTKDRSQSKVKHAPPGAPDIAAASTRPSRGRGAFESARGGRGRGTDRGRGGFRGGRGASANGVRNHTADSAIPSTTETSAWDTPLADSSETQEKPAWDTPGPSDGAPEVQGGGAETAAQSTAPESQKGSVIPTGGSKTTTWAKLFDKPKPAPAPPKPVATIAKEQTPPEVPSTSNGISQQSEADSVPVPSNDDTQIDGPETPDIAADAAVDEPVQPDLELTPSKDQLTEDNVEHLPDVSVAAPTGTAASTVASSRDIGSVAGTPANAVNTQQPIGRPPMGGFATSAYKATATPGRSASFQRRVLEQHEAVVMPGNHAVEKAAVQFGSMGLNGDADTLDVDEDREEAETRTQPPQHSPPTQPRASLPPAPRQAQPDITAQDGLPTPKAAPGLPPAPQAAQQSPIGNSAMSHQGSQGSHPYNQFGRYGQSNVPAELSAPAQKPYDPFGQQAAQSSFDAYGGHGQAQNQQHQSQSQLGGFSSAPNDYSSYQTTDQTRNAYQNYYGNSYGQQTGSTQQDAGAAQQRTGSAFGAAPSDSNYGNQSQVRRTFKQDFAQYARQNWVKMEGSDNPHIAAVLAGTSTISPSIISPSPDHLPQIQNRYGDAQNSGHTTPNPAVGGQHQAAAQSSQAQQMHQPQGQTSHNNNYPYGHPYYNSPYYNAYVNQYGYGHQGGFNAPFGKGGGMYGQPNHGYGMSPQTSYDQHSSSPANVSGFGQSSMHGRESTLGGGMGEYGRSGSTQPTQNQQNTGSGAFGGGMPESFGRSQGGFPAQSLGYGQQQSAQQTGAEDTLKPFGETKAAGGPSPSLGQPGRPGSAANNTAQGGQTGLPPPQSHQQGFGGYPGHLGQASQYGGLGGLGGHQAGAQSHQQGQYGGQYGGGFGGGSYGSYGGRGWGTNYGGTH
ncbi:hypothetical protein K402DRAFT_424698 [Aulographum hederae CBS 113979]|uniref:RNA polymerase II degradation factor 1 n=1 Tax=Aulographum hederae CBS 113979 TaxID=1176131 RepID=A0A6G1GMV8_9PEZI|nr:hypothetical protein K402DRAFT_424698 [Aulographum hederae CBS 113979]